MRWPGFLGAVWKGSVRVERCPYCRSPESIARRPPPFDVRCRSCGRIFRITEGGVMAGGSRP